MLDTLVLCQFVWGPAWTLYGPQETADMVKAVTGWDVTIDELMQVGARRLNLMRMFNAREGFDRKQENWSPHVRATRARGDTKLDGIALSGAKSRSI